MRVIRIRAVVAGEDGAEHGRDHVPAPFDPDLAGGGSHGRIAVDLGLQVVLLVGQGQDGGTQALVVRRRIGKPHWGRPWCGLAVAVHPYALADAGRHLLDAGRSVVVAELVELAAELQALDVVGAGAAVGLAAHAVGQQAIYDEGVLVQPRGRAIVAV